MPWRLKKQIWLILIGCIVLAIAIAVFILNQNVSSDLLAIVGFFGGLAIIINTLPSDENGDKKKT